MANKKIEIQFDLNNDDVKIASERTLTLAQQVRILKQELQKLPEGSKEFDILKNKLNETKDNFERVNVKSRELFGTLSLIPGPIGEIAGKLNGAISLFKTFSGFSLKDITSQIKALGQDIKQVLINLGSWGGDNKKVSESLKDVTDSSKGLNAQQAASLAQSQKIADTNKETSKSYAKAVQDQQILTGSLGKTAAATQLLTKEDRKSTRLNSSH